MNLQMPTLRTVAVSLLIALTLVACGGAAEEVTPTIPVEQIQTEAVATFSADLTATAFALPTNTPTEPPTPTITPTFPPAISVTPSLAVQPTSAAGSCYGLTFVSDVTIPDNTNMTPGQQFTKTWRVRNSGTCEWQTGFRLNFTGGEAMGGSSVSLSSAVQPGNTADISVNLTAPNTAGTYRGNWRMANASGSYFGDEIFLVIVVGNATATRTQAPAATATQTPTITPTLTPTEEGS